MGVNNQGQQMPAMSPGLSPVQQAQAMNQYGGIAPVQASALTPYSGKGPAAGAATAGIAQIAAALLAKKQLADWQKKWGVQSPTVAATTPAGIPQAGAATSPVAAPMGVPDA